MPTTTGGSGSKLTYTDFLAFPDDGMRHELIDGVHYVTPSPVLPHQRVIGNVYFLLRRHLEDHAGGMVYVSPVDVVFTMFDVVVPDLLFIQQRRQVIVGDKNIQGAPDLAIEVLSPGTRKRDEGVKLELYDRGGVTEYWVVDPIQELVRVYRRERGPLTLVAELLTSRNDTLRSPMFPDLALGLGKIFSKS